MEFVSGSLAWFPCDDDEVVIPVTVTSTIKAGNAGEIKRVEDNSRLKLSGNETKQLLVMHRESLNDFEDMVNMQDLNDYSVLHNLRTRYADDNIYTHVGDILVAINPFKELPLYSPNVTEKYIRDARRQPPHVFSVAKRALEGFPNSQSCIVSGESGSGKTETTKIFMEFLSLSYYKNSDGENKIQTQILKSSPILESFGNAKTTRNNNSSRFGKWMEIYLTRSGQIDGACISSYLLEKSRVVTLGPGERNYHIFYQLCAAYPLDESLEAVNLRPASGFQYLKLGNCLEIDHVSDYVEWQSTRDALRAFTSASEYQQIVCVLSIVLHLGNVELTELTLDSSCMKSDEAAAIVEELMQIESLEEALTKRILVVGNESTYANNSVAQAKSARDSLAKHMYLKLFDWIIAKINKQLGDKKPVQGMIGILDIFGFESFTTNSLEQLCINYCNEVLQGHFNNYIFNMERDIYNREGIDLKDVHFQDNRSVIEAIEEGIFCTIEEQIKLVNRAPDSHVLVHILKHSSTCISSVMKRKNECFLFRHYAGPVQYDIKGFLGKSKNIVQLSLSKLGSSSKNKLVRQLFQQQESKSSSKTIGLQFKNQLQKLMKTLEGTTPHFIRCLKPNNNKESDHFNSRVVLTQLQYAGMMEVCKIRKMGYPCRVPFKQFISKYSVLAGHETNPKKLCKLLDKKSLLSDFQIGKTMVFLKSEFELEFARETFLSRHVIRIQSLIRKVLAMSRLSRWFNLKDELCNKNHSVDILHSLLLRTGELPYGGKHLKWVQEVHEEVKYHVKQLEILQLLQMAVETHDLARLKAGLEKAKEFDRSHLVQEAEDMVALLEERKSIHRGLDSAVDMQVEDIEELLKRASRVGMANDERVTLTKKLFKHKKKQQKVILRLKMAVSDNDLESMQKQANKLVQLGMPNHPLVVKAEQLVRVERQITKERETRSRDVLARLKEAQSLGDLQTLELLQLEMEELGLHDHDIAVSAMYLLDELQQQQKVLEEIEMETRALEIHQDPSILLALLKQHSDLSNMAVVMEASKLAKHIQARNDGLEEIVSAVQATRELNSIDAKPLVNAALLVASQLVVNNSEVVILVEWLAQVMAKETVLNRQEYRFRKMVNQETLKLASKDELEEITLTRLSQFSSEQHSILLERAANDSIYDLNLFFKLRSDEDFVRYVESDSDKEKYARLKLWSSSDIIVHSLTTSVKDKSLAFKLNKAILQFCGDIPASYTVSLAQFVLLKGLEQHDVLADEIYMQLCRHTYANPNKTSLDRCWRLMCLATVTFPCSPHLAPFLANYLIRQSYLGKHYAQFCLLQLDRTLQRGPSKFRPALEDIEAYVLRPPIVAPIAAPDGTIRLYPITPDLQVRHVLHIVGNGSADDGIFVAPAIRPPNGSKMNDYKKRLQKFYQHYNPSKMQQVPMFLDHWKNREEELMQKLVQHYGPEPEEHSPSNGKKQKRTFFKKTKMQELKMIPWPLPSWVYLGDISLRLSTSMEFQCKRSMIQQSLLDQPDKQLCMQLVQSIREGSMWVKKEAQAIELASVAYACAKRIGMTHISSPQQCLSPYWAGQLDLTELTVKEPKTFSKLSLALVEKCINYSPVASRCVFKAVVPNALAVGFDGLTLLAIDGDDESTLKSLETFSFKSFPKCGATDEFFWLILNDQKKIFNTSQSWEILDLANKWRDF